MVYRVVILHDLETFCLRRQKLLSDERLDSIQLKRCARLPVKLDVPFWHLKVELGSLHVLLGSYIFSSVS